MTGGFFSVDGRVEELKRLHALGFTSGQIRIAMGAPTRNVIIGKLTRLGLSRAAHQGTLTQRRLARVTVTVLAPVEPPSPPAPAAEAPAHVCTLLTAGYGECRWMTGGGLNVCGHRVVFGTSWCSFHRQRVFSQVQTRSAHRGGGDGESVESAA